MPDYGRPLQFGISVVPQADAVTSVTAAVQAADAGGLELVGIQDHPYQRRFLDTWTLISFLAAQTERVRFFPDVANLPLRPPAVLAKSVATLDRLAGGRVELGLGAGGFWDAIEAIGGPRRTPGESVEALEEAIDVIRLMWSTDRSVSYDGRHYTLRGVHPGPPPAHEVGIWLGAYKPRMLRLTGRSADGWIPSYFSMPPDQAANAAATIDEAARAAGRDPAAIVRAYNIGGTIREGDGDADGKIVGDANYWARTLATIATDVGFDTFIFWPDDHDPEQIRAFIEDVVPKVRDVVATFRNP